MTMGWHIGLVGQSDRGASHRHVGPALPTCAGDLNLVIGAGPILESDDEAESEEEPARDLGAVLGDPLEPVCPVGCQNWPMGCDQWFQAAGSYSLTLVCVSSHQATAGLLVVVGVMVAVRVR
jgi:hypothetical protein